MNTETLAPAQFEPVVDPDVFEKQYGFPMAPEAQADLAAMEALDKAPTRAAFDQAPAVEYDQNAPTMDKNLLMMALQYGNTEFGKSLGRFLVTDLAVRSAVYYSLGQEAEPESHKWARYYEKDKDSSDK
jgi:hypothetical protein